MSAPDALDEIMALPEASPTWRAPTPGEHVCKGCGGAACFGLYTIWLCRTCIPADFLPAARVTA